MYPSLAINLKIIQTLELSFSPILTALLLEVYVNIVVNGNLKPTNTQISTIYTALHNHIALPSSTSEINF